MPIAEWKPIAPKKKPVANSTTMAQTTTPTTQNTTQNVKTKRPKKSVRFAEVLEHICVFNTLDPPEFLLQPAAKFDLVLPASMKTRLSDLPNMILYQTIAIERITMKSDVILVTVVVGNISFEKAVTLRYTWDSWKTYVDVPASHINSCGNGMMDRFQAKIPAISQSVTDTVIFCARFNCNDKSFWDNNAGSNYTVKFAPPSPRILTKKVPALDISLDEHPSLLLQRPGRQRPLSDLHSSSDDAFSSTESLDEISEQWLRPSRSSSTTATPTTTPTTSTSSSSSSSFSSSSASTPSTTSTTSTTLFNNQNSSSRKAKLVNTPIELPPLQQGFGSRLLSWSQMMGQSTPEYVAMSPPELPAHFSSLDEPVFGTSPRASFSSSYYRPVQINK